MKKFLAANFILIIILVIAAFLRLYKLNANPVSLFGDELDVGYHAYSVLKTGKDYYGNPWPLNFHSIAEWRAPLYIYSTIPTVALFGISPLGVRLPAAIFGILGVFGIYILIKEILSYGVKPAANHPRALFAAFLLAINPWHIQYSRAAFEVTELLAFLIFGLYFFFRSFQKPQRIWLSVFLLTITPWIYSTAKLFMPFFLLVLFVIWKKEILKLPKKYLFQGVITGLIIGMPLVYATFYGGGNQRFSYISVFSDPTVSSQVDIARRHDADFRKALPGNYSPTITEKFFHNKVFYWVDVITTNLLQSVSTEFLFAKGDPNPRHTIINMGLFYKIDVVLLILGLIYFFGGNTDRRIKTLVAGWFLIGLIPSALTRDGGHHATRLILILPPLVFLMSYGFVQTFRDLKWPMSQLFAFGYSIVCLFYFLNYTHNYYIHYPWNSERWFHSGFREVVKTVKEIDKDYDKVIFSMGGEPVWIFFAGWYEYPPDKWQKEFPIGNTEFFPGFGDASKTGKYYFAQFDRNISIFALSRYIDNRTLYMATPMEIGENLVAEPWKGPSDLKLVKVVAYPSGEPAYYLFAKK